MATPRQGRRAHERASFLNDDPQNLTLATSRLPPPDPPQERDFANLGEAFSVFGHAIHLVGFAFSIVGRVLSQPDKIFSPIGKSRLQKKEYDDAASGAKLSRLPRADSFPPKPSQAETPIYYA